MLGLPSRHRRRSPRFEAGAIRTGAARGGLTFLKQPAFFARRDRSHE
jgi:hypothetical protein